MGDTDIHQKASACEVCIGAVYIEVNTVALERDTRAKIGHAEGT